MSSNAGLAVGPPEGDYRPANSRFCDSRQKYMMFVNTCNEKRVIAERAIAELPHLQPRPPAIRIFDAGVGDGTILTRLMRSMHERFESVPFYVVGKEVSMEDVRATLDKLPDRFREHPATVVVLTNLYYTEAPALRPRSDYNAARLLWRELALKGRTAAEFEQQINELEPFLAKHWRASVNARNGGTVYDEPVVLVLYVENQRFLLNDVLPKRDAIVPTYDLILASQPYRARAPAEFKARTVVAPLARALAPGGRLLGIHACGNDPAFDIVRRVLPNEKLFFSSRYDILRETEIAMAKEAHQFEFDPLLDEDSKFRYDMYTLPTENQSAWSSIGTSTLLAAWNNATYVAQLEDHRVAEAVRSDFYLKVTEEVLQTHSGLWFSNESFVISRK